MTLKHNTSGVTAGTYNSVTVDEKGHVTAGSNPTTLSDYGITDAKIENGTITLGSNTIIPLTGNDVGAAAAKGVDTSISSGSTSTNLPTTAAVATYVDNHTVTVENASSTVAGVLKVRLDDNTHTLYITNNGQDA
jgi:phage-related tail fiber protein